MIWQVAIGTASGKWRFRDTGSDSADKLAFLVHVLYLFVLYSISRLSSSYRVTNQMFLLLISRLIGLCFVYEFYCIALTTSRR